MFLSSITSSSQTASTNTAEPQDTTSAQPSQVSTDLCKTSNAPPHLGAMQNLAIKGSASFTPASHEMYMHSCPANVNPEGEPHLNVMSLDGKPDPTGWVNTNMVIDEFKESALRNYADRKVYDLNSYVSTLAFTQKKPVAAIFKKASLQAGSELKITCKDIHKINEETDYPGQVMIFKDDPSNTPSLVKAYLNRALEKAPKLLLKLVLGYVKDGVGRTVLVKAWNEIDGKTGEFTNKMQYKLVGLKADGTVDKQTPAGLSKLVDSDEMWLYETGKRYPRSDQSLQVSSERAHKTIG